MEGAGLRAEGLRDGPLGGRELELPCRDKASADGRARLTRDVCSVLTCERLLRDEFPARIPESDGSRLLASGSSRVGSPSDCTVCQESDPPSSLLAVLRRASRSPRDGVSCSALARVPSSAERVPPFDEEQDEDEDEEVGRLTGSSRGLGVACSGDGSAGGTLLPLGEGNGEGELSGSSSKSNSGGGLRKEVTGMVRGGFEVKGLVVRTGGVVRSEVIFRMLS